jgi:hypothetical protein
MYWSLQKSDIDLRKPLCSAVDKYVLYTKEKTVNRWCDGIYEQGSMGAGGWFGIVEFIDRKRVMNERKEISKRVW